MNLATPSMPETEDCPVDGLSSGQLPACWTPKTAPSVALAPAWLPGCRISEPFAAAPAWGGWLSRMKGSISPRVLGVENKQRRRWVEWGKVGLENSGRRGETRVHQSVPYTDALFG